jgi:hypothetical protein
VARGNVLSKIGGIMVNRIELGAVKSVRIHKPQIVSDCAYKNVPETACTRDNGLPCDKQACKKWSNIVIEVIQEADLDLVVSTITLVTDRQAWKENPCIILED